VLCLAFTLAESGYLLPVDEVERVVPAVAARPLVGTHPAVLGLIEFMREPLPVIDLRRLWHGTPCALHYSTRIVVVPWRDKKLGLQVEALLSPLRIDPAAAVKAGLQQAAGLGAVVEERQLVSVQALLTPEVAAGIFEDGAA
jgi:chemotaxis signal transduction protein